MGMDQTEKQKEVPALKQPRRDFLPGGGCQDHAENERLRRREHLHVSLILSSNMRWDMPPAKHGSEFRGQTKQNKQAKLPNL